MLAAFASEFGLPEETAIKIAAPFGAGISRTGGICGVVNGGLMVLGLKFASPASGNKDGVYSKSREFIQRFREKQGSMACPDLIGFDLSFPDQYVKAKSAQVFNTVCPGLIEGSVEIILGLIGS